MDYYHICRRRDLRPEDMLAAGLVRKSTRDGSLYDNFRHRLMFPIANPRGEVIAFGGRALDGDQEPKYLNSADSPMFHKKQVLYGLKQAREQMKAGLPVIVAEGYMDVIAIDQFKVAGAVAPLGTALTEDQIMLIWKSAPAPYLCFDGDTAGQRAANKTLARNTAHS
jgi:DNA primase